MVKAPPGRHLSQTQTPSRWWRLDDLLVSVLEFLPTEASPLVLVTCGGWAQLARHPGFWNGLLSRHGWAPADPDGDEGDEQPLACTRARERFVACWARWRPFARALSRGLDELLDAVPDVQRHESLLSCVPPPSPRVPFIPLLESAWRVLPYAADEEEVRLEPRTFGKLWSRLVWIPTAEAEEHDDAREMDHPRWGRWVDPGAIREGRTETDLLGPIAGIEAAWGYQRVLRGAGEIAERARVGWLFSMRLIVTIEASAARVRDALCAVERRAATWDSATVLRSVRESVAGARVSERLHRDADIVRLEFGPLFVRYARLVVAAKRAGADAADQDAFAVIEHGPVLGDGARVRAEEAPAPARSGADEGAEAAEEAPAPARPAPPGADEVDPNPGPLGHIITPGGGSIAIGAGGDDVPTVGRRAEALARLANIGLSHTTMVARDGDAAARDEAQRGARGAGGGASEYRIYTPEQLTPAELYEREEGHVWLEGSGFLVVPVKQPTHHDRHPKVPLQCEVTYVVRLRVPDDRIDEWMFRWKTLIHERTTALFELKEICEAEEERATAASAS